MKMFFSTKEKCKHDTNQPSLAKFRPASRKMNLFAKKIVFRGMKDLCINSVQFNYAPYNSLHISHLLRSWWESNEEEEKLMEIFQIAVKALEKKLKFIVKAKLKNRFSVNIYFLSLA